MKHIYLSLYVLSHISKKTVFPTSKRKFIMVSKQAVRNACQGCLNLTLPGLKKIETKPVTLSPF